MGKQVQVILLEDIDSLGQTGDIVSVAEGYARNTLFPSGRAALADETAKARSKAKQDKATAEEKQQLAALQEQADQLDGTELQLSARVKDGDDIFGSITAAMIAKELKNQAEVAVKARDVELPEAITKIGSHDVVIHLATDVDTTIRVTVVPEAGSELGGEEDEE